MFAYLLHHTRTVKIHSPKSTFKRKLKKGGEILIISKSRTVTEVLTNLIVANQFMLPLF